MDWEMFRSEGLAKALTDAGHTVSPRTVDRWKAGTHQPSKGQLQGIRDLVGAGTKEEAAPDVPGRLDDTYALVRLTALKVGVDSRLVEQIEEARRDALAQARGGQPIVARRRKAKPDPPGG